jgi:hypothetical protein
MRFVLRLWPANALLQPGDTPLWIGSAQVLKHQQAVGLVGLWRPLREADAALLAVTVATQPLAHRIDAHPQSHLPVLRIRTDQEAGSAPGHNQR